MEISEARKQYKKGNISFLELNKIFKEKATKEQLDEFWNAPVFDRPYIVEGLNQAQRDACFNEIIS